MTNRFLIQFLESNHFPVSIPISNLNEFIFQLNGYPEFIGKNILISCHPSNPLVSGKEIASVEVYNQDNSCLYRKFLIPDTCYSLLLDFSPECKNIIITVKTFDETFNNENIFNKIGKNSNIDTIRCSTMKHYMDSNFSLMELAIIQYYTNNEMMFQEVDQLYSPIEKGILDAKFHFKNIVSRMKTKQKILMRNYLLNIKKMMEESPPSNSTPIQFLLWSQNQLNNVEKIITSCENQLQFEVSLQTLRESNSINDEVFMIFDKLIRTIPLLLSEIQHRGLDRVDSFENIVFERKRLNSKISLWISNRIPKIEKTLKELTN